MSATIYSPTVIRIMWIFAFIAVVGALADATRGEWALALDGLAIAALDCIVATLMRQVNAHFNVGLALLSLPTERRSA